VKYRRIAKGVEAQITLPPGMSGTATMNAHQTSLHAGQQRVILQ